MIGQAPPLPESVESDQIASSWVPAVRERYRRFATVLAARHVLSLTVGRGGLSFYAPTAARRVFVCHFNAAPRGGRDDLGFADFKPSALAPQLDPDAVVADLQRHLGPALELRAGKTWHGVHFARENDLDVADSFRHAVVDAFLARAG